MRHGCERFERAQSMNGSINEPLDVETKLVSMFQRDSRPANPKSVRSTQR